MQFYQDTHAVFLLVAKTDRISSVNAQNAEIIGFTRSLWGKLRQMN
jgi:hypothetical protein